MKQVKFKDIENNEVHGGILTDDGDVICGCCGGLIPADELTEEYGHIILEEFSEWASLDEAILN